MAVSRSLKTLEAMGLIERHRKFGDRRVDRITVTQDGYDLLLKDPLGRIHDALTDFDETEQLKIVDGMQGLLDIVQRHGRLPDFGPRRNCTHHKPDACHETGAVGCRCGASRRIKLFGGRQNLRGFLADELGNAGFHIFFHRRPKFLRYFDRAHRFF